MTTGTHILAGVIAALYLNLPVIPAAVGCVIPDIDIKKGFPKKKTLFNSHRGITHHLFIPVLLILLSIYIRNIGFEVLYKNTLSFSIGYATHLILDMLTPIGIPYTHKFYPRLSLKIFKSGKLSELIVFLSLLLIFSVIVQKKQFNIKNLFGNENISILNGMLK